MSSYKNYFKDHYKVSFTSKDIMEWQGWFMGEWRLIKKHLKIREGMSVLDIGAGSGGFYQVLKEECEWFSYRGLDLDKDIVKFANKHFDTNNFAQQKFEDYKPTRKHDLIVAFEVLEHVHNPSEIVAKIYRDLNKKGVFCGTTPFPFKKNIISDATHISVLHPDNWHRLFTDAGFKKVVTKPMSYPPLIWRIHPSLNFRIPFNVWLPGFVSTTLIYAEK